MGLGFACTTRTIGDSALDSVRLADICKGGGYRYLTRSHLEPGIVTAIAQA
jgi:hypothetical protein